MCVSGPGDVEIWEDGLGKGTNKLQECRRREGPKPFVYRRSESEIRAAWLV